MHSVVAVAIELTNKPARGVDSSLATLIELDHRGELEAFILLAKPDDGIAPDYPLYLPTTTTDLARM